MMSKTLVNHFANIYKTDEACSPTSCDITVSIATYYSLSHTSAHKLTSMGPTAAGLPAVSERRSAVDDDASMLAWQLTTASILPMTLKTAIELDLLEILVAGCGGPSGKLTMTTADVALHLDPRNPQVRNLLKISDYWKIPAVRISQFS